MGINKNFVVKNGLEVDSSLIHANASTNRVGIGTSVPTHLLHVNGGIAATHVNVSGVATINTLVLDGAITIGNTYGQALQYLTADGSGGVTWSSLPELRTSLQYTATADQVDFDFTTVVAYVDVYVNGVKLTSDSYSYISGIKVVLNEPAFEDDIVEIVGYATNTVGSSTAGATIGGVTIFENDTLRGVSGFVTSINFVGPTVGVTSTGYGVTVYSSAGGGGDSYWSQTDTGISTTSNVGVGTTNATHNLTVDGDASISGLATVGSLYVDGNVESTGIITATEFDGSFTGDGSGLTNITASAVNTGWYQSSVGIGTTANVGLGTTNPQYQVEIGQFGQIGTSLYVHGGVEATSDVSIGGSITVTGELGAGGIVIDNALIDAPALISVGGTAVRILGDLYVDGTQTTTNSVDLQLTDKIVGLGTTSTPEDIGADGGGIILYGDTHKEILWSYTTDSWTSNVDFDLDSDKSYKIGGEDRLSYGLLSVPNATVSGVVTASTVSAGIVTVANTLYAQSYTGNGSGLSGIVTSIAAGTNISISGSNGKVTINATGSGGSGTNVSISTNAPSSPFSGDLWYDSDLGRGFIYYVDDDSSQWVDFSPNGGTQSNTITVENNGTPLPQAISNINFTGNVSISTSIAGIATIGINTDVNVLYTSIAGIATYATTAGVSTTAQGLSGTPNLNVGVVTATSFVGDGSGITSVTASPSGSDGQIQYNNGGLTSGTSDLYYDDTNNAVGLGTTSPIAKLDVNGTLNVTGVSTFSGITSFRNDIHVHRTDGNIRYLSFYDVNGNNQGSVLTAGDGGSGRIEVNGSYKLRFGATGDVEITDGAYSSTKRAVFGDAGAEFYAGFSTSSSKVLETNTGGVTVTGVCTATSFSGDGSGLTGVTAVGTGIGVEDSSSAVGTATTVDFGSNLSVSPVVAGVVTVTAAAGSSYTDSDVDTHLNQSTAGSGEVLSWSGSDYEWVAQSGGGSSAYADVSGISTSVIGGISSVTQLDVSGISTLGGNANFGANAYLGDNGAIWFGDGLNPGVVGDLQIYSGGTTSYIEERTSALRIYSNDLYLQDYTNAKVYLHAQASGSVELNYNNVAKFETTSTGVNVSGTTTTTNLNVTGIATAPAYYTNSTNGDGGDRGFTTKYYITSNGSTAYRFAGPGVLNTGDNPTLYFHRGFSYILENSTGSSHPFELRVSAGGAAYAPGGNFLTGSTSGTQILTVPFDAPSSIVYQCTIHSGMVGTINFVS